MPDADATDAASGAAPPTLRTVIVDDEPPARNLVDEYLADYDHVTVVGTAGSGREALECIADTDPDLVFLDVQMPGLDGFDVLERLETLPHIIFSTAYDEYALDAFDAGAVDYLLKPYSRERFRTAVERVTERARQAAASDAAPGRSPDAYADRLAALLQEARSTEAEAPLDRLYVRHGKKIVPVAADDIRWIEAAGDYAKLHTTGDTHLCSMGLGDLAERLDGDRFARVHRSHIVALDAIDHLRSDGSGGYVAMLDDGTTVRVSRSYAPQIRDRIV
jgi:two-component system LytT family response regulator